MGDWHSPANVIGMGVTLFIAAVIIKITDDPWMALPAGLSGGFLVAVVREIIRQRRNR